jgi:hypothetical protein
MQFCPLGLGSHTEVSGCLQQGFHQSIAFLDIGSGGFPAADAFEPEAEGLLDESGQGDATACCFRLGCTVNGVIDPQLSACA